ncbi:MAG: carboxypeptidase regulatory-like domain-containing protein [Opitutae bacterium]|nr:carboxypeptidase regulatory-like domain-containing protein [Opitutae bacterium]
MAKPSEKFRLIRAALPLVLLAVILAASASAGTITGTVIARGATDAPDATGGDAYASRRYKFVERVDYDQLHDFVVNIEGEFVGEKFSPPAKAAVVSQQDASFVPHVLPILVGTTVEWPNLDDIYHNVFCMADTKQFDLGLYDRDHPAKRVVFDKTGRADVFCSIHAKMHCIVLVFANPFFATTDDRGRFTLRDVPAGAYRLRAWHERVPSQVKEIVVPADGEVRVDFVLGPGNLPKY